VGGHQTGQSHFYLWTSYPTLRHHSLFGFSRGTLLANDKKKKKKEKERLPVIISFADKTSIKTGHTNCFDNQPAGAVNPPQERAHGNSENRLM
jgi:hypothetical protein